MGLYDIAKRAMDVAGATAGLVGTLPITVPVAIAIRTTMGSPIFFKQERPGKDGEPFELIKFRTMREPKPGEGMLETDGLRITPLGHFLRSSSIDEFPTFWNVLRGDMSLVGPRPLLMRYLPRYSPEQMRRHEVRPGITGWAQVNGRNALNWEQKFAHDVWYVDNRSLGLDLRILLMTVLKVLEREGISQEGQATMSEFMGNGKPAVRAAAE